jgi:hypothetical protein
VTNSIQEIVSIYQMDGRVYQGADGVVLLHYCNGITSVSHHFYGQDMSWQKGLDERWAQQMQLLLYFVAGIMSWIYGKRP